MTCTKPLSITITIPGCPDWTQLLWAAPTVTGVVPGQTGYTAAPGAGTQQNHAETSGFSNDTAGQNLQFQMEGTLAYDGPGCVSCNLHIAFAETFPADPNTANGQITVLKLGPVVVFANQNVNGSSPASMDIPFTIPAGTYTIIVRITWGINNAADPGTATINANVVLT